MPRGKKRTWIAQDAKQLAKVGEKAASWVVYFNDPDGKRRSQACGPGPQGKKLAATVADRIHAELLTGTYESKRRETWEQFRHEFDRLALVAMSERTARETKNALAHFERIVKPVRMSAINSKAIETYKTTRRTEDGKKSGAKVSPASINKELRHLKMVLRKAVRWKFLREMPAIDFEREPEKLIVFVTPEHFTAIYEACKTAKLPAGDGFTAGDWWQAIVIMAYMTGWRIGELLRVERADVDLAKGIAITRHGDNKGRRDEVTQLHPIVVQHLKKIKSFDPRLFAYDGNDRPLYTQFAEIQEAAGIKLPCRAKHDHTRFCHVYGFHDFRRAFATQNARDLSPLQLKTMMRHRSFTTTQRYINLAVQSESITDKLFVPTLKPAKAAKKRG